MANDFLRSLIEIAAILYILLILQDRTYLPKINKIFWAFFLFVIAFTVTTVTSMAPFSSFWGSLERMGGLWTFGHYFVFFVILISVLRSKQDWNLFLEIIIVSGILSAIYGFGQKTDMKFFIGSGNRARIFGTLGNPALFAGYQLLTLFLAGTLFFRKDNSRNKKIFFGLLFCAALFVIFSLTMKNTAFVTKSSYLTRVTNLSFGNFTVQTRFWAWQAGLKGWSESPRTVLLGWGPENFNIPFSKNFNPKFFTGPGSETLFDRAHNMFVEVLVTMGLLGFLAYLAIFGVLFKSLWQLKNKLEYRIPAIGFIAMVVAYVIHNAFIFDTSANL